MKKLAALLLLTVVSCVPFGTRYRGMHDGRSVYELTCPNDQQACNQMARHACRNADWATVIKPDVTATSNHLWIECEF